MQPRPPISDILLFDGLPPTQLETFFNLDTAYVGLVPETGSLFIMTTEHYPLVAFGDTEYSPNSRLLDPSPSSDTNGDLPNNIDSVTKRRKLLELCRQSPFDARCLTGKRGLDLSGLSSRQLPGVPSVDLPVGVDGGRNNDIEFEETRRSDSSPAPSSNLTHDAKSTGDRFSLPAVGSMLLVMLFGATWLFRDKSSFSRILPLSTSPQEGLKDANVSVLSLSSAPPVPDVQAISNGDVNGTTDVPASVSEFDTPPPFPPSTAPRRQSVYFSDPAEIQDIPDSPATPAAEIGEDSEKEGDTGATPKKRKAPRRRRGKKGKGNNQTSNGPADDGAATENDANGSTREENWTENGDPSPDAPLPSATLVVPSTPKSPAPSLVVSDTILGKFVISLWVSTNRLQVLVRMGLSCTAAPCRGVLSLSSGSCKTLSPWPLAKSAFCKNRMTIPMSFGTTIRKPKPTFYISLWNCVRPPWQT